MESLQTAVFCTLNGLEQREPFLLARVGACEEHCLRTEPDGVADTLRAEDPRAAALAVPQGIPSDARLARCGLGAGGAEPGLPAADQRRLTGAAFRRPALVASLRADTRPGGGAPSQRD